MVRKESIIIVHQNWIIPLVRRIWKELMPDFTTKKVVDIASSQALHLP